MSLSKSKKDSVNRRDFIQGSAAGVAVLAASVVPIVRRVLSDAEAGIFMRF